MQEDITLTLLQNGALQVTAYSLMMVAAALAGIALIVGLNVRRHGIDRCLNLALATLLGAVLGGHLIYCLTNISTILADYNSGAMLFLRFDLGGYTLYGAVLGILAAIAVYGAVSHQNILNMTDAVVPGTLAALCVGRAAEYFTNQGLGEWIEDAALARLPFAVEIVYELDDFSEWRVPVFMYEAIAAAVMLIVVLVLRGRRGQYPGRLTGTALTLLGTSQIFLEQLRQDDYVRFGFVRFTQIAALTLLVAVLAIRLIRAARAKGWTLPLSLRVLVFLAGVAIVILVEFGLEKPQVLPYLRPTAVLLAAASGYGLIDLARRNGGKAAFGVSCAAAVLLVAASCVAFWLLTRELEWENILLMALMAAAVIAMAVAVQTRAGEAETA